MPSPASDRRLVVVAALALAAAGAQGAAQLIHVFVLDGRYQSLLDVDSNNSVFDLLSVAVEAVAVVACLSLAGLRPSRRARFVALAALIAFIAVDDALGLHDRFPVDWPVVLAPVLACTLLLLWSAPASPEARSFLRGGLLLLGASVVLGQAAALLLNAHGWEARPWPYELKIVVKQGAELAGWVLVAGVLVLEARLPSRRPAAVARRSAAPSGSV